MSQRDLDHTILAQASRPFSGPRARLSEKETEDRLFAAAEAMIEVTGLTVGLDHLRFEDVISQAGVARSAAYRLYPYKEAFYAKLLCKLAGPSWAGTAAFDETTIDLATATLLSHLPHMTTPEGRQFAIIDSCRVGAEQNFKTLVTSPQWRTYIALNAAVTSMPDGELRSQLLEALELAENGFIERMAAFYEQMAGLIGVRLRPEFGNDFKVLAALGAAVVEGLGLRASLNPVMVNRRFNGFGVGDIKLDDWSMASIGFTSIFTSMLEPDPTWTPDRLETLGKLAEGL